MISASLQTAWWRARSKRGKAPAPASPGPGPSTSVSTSRAATAVTPRPAARSTPMTAGIALRLLRWWGQVLGEKRCWRWQRLTGRDWLRLPGAAGHGAAEAEQRVEALRRVGEVGREEHLEAVEHLNHRVDDRGGALLVHFDDSPGRLLVQIAVGGAGNGQRLAQPVAQMDGLDGAADRAQSLAHLDQHRLVGRDELPGSGHEAGEVALGEGEHAVHGVAVGRHQLVVVATHQLLKGEVAVASLRHRGGQVIA